MTSISLPSHQVAGGSPATCHHPADRASLNRRVDVGQALSALARCAADRANGLSGDDRDDAAPGSLLRSALAHLGMTIDEFEAAPLVPEKPGSALGSDRTPVLTLGALVVLRAADRRQRAGSDWRTCVITAERAAHRYLSIVPARILTEAVAHR
jgi:hypothetical protein